MRQLVIVALLFMISSIRADVDRLEAELHDATGIERARILNTLSADYLQVDSRKSLAYASQALEVAKANESVDEQKRALLNLGNAHGETGSYDQALSCFEQVISLEESAGGARKLTAPALNNIGRIYRYQGDYEKAMEHFQRALIFAEGQDDKEALAAVYNNMGIVYRKEMEFAKALQYYKRALHMKEISGDSVGVAKCLNNIGNIYAWQADYARALEYHMRSLRIKERVGDKATVAPSLTNIGNIYRDFGNPDKALEYYLRGLQLNEELGNPRSISFSLESIGSVYEDKNDLEGALTYYRRALEVLEPIGEKQRIGICHRRIGMVLKEQGDYDLALSHYKRAIDIQDEMADYAGLTVTLREIGDIKRELGAYSEALEYVEKSQRIAREGNIRKELLKNYQTQARLLEDMGLFGKSLAALRRYDSLKDSLFNEETSERIAEMQIRYDTERQEREIEVLKTEKQMQHLALNKQKSFRNYMLLCSLLVLILGAVVYNRYTLKRRSNELLEGKNAELELANRQLMTSEEELRRLNATKDRFFSIIAHDLRSPMNAFLGLSEMLAQNAETLDKHDIEESIKAINETAMNLFTLLENLLQWARMQTESMPFNPQKVTIASCLEKDVELLKVYAEDKGIKLIIDIDENTAVYADASMATAVMRNLLSNAIKFTAQGGEVRLESRPAGRFIELSVKDTGVGIRDEDRGKLFRIDVHHTTVGTADEGGTGLGLILCKEFIEKHGGEIWVESSEGQGSVFRFTLPAAS